MKPDPPKTVTIRSLELENSLIMRAFASSFQDYLAKFIHSSMGLFDESNRPRTHSRFAHSRLAHEGRRAMIGMRD